MPLETRDELFIATVQCHTGSTCVCVCVFAPLGMSTYCTYAYSCSLIWICCVTTIIMVDCRTH